MEQPTESGDQKSPTQNDTPKPSRSLLSHPLLTGIVGVAIGAVLVPLVAPVLTRAGNRIADRWTPAPLPVTVLVCAPLRDSRTVLSVTTPNGPRVVADAPHNTLNDTFIFVENTSSGPIKNATLTAYPLGFRKESPTLEFAEAGFTSIHGSADYKISYQKSINTIELRIPQLNPNEAILIQERYFQPVGYIVELYADGLTEQKNFQPGCSDEIDVKLPIERATKAYFGPHCTSNPEAAGAGAGAGAQQQTRCTVDDNIPFEMTEEMRGQKLVQQDLVVEDPIRVRFRALRPDLTR